MVGILFGQFVFDSASGLLDDKGKSIPVNGRGQAILETLLAAQGKTVTKLELMERVWPGQIVEEGNLAVQIAALRKLLGERQDGGEWIVTVPRVGYRMVSPQAPSVSIATAKVAAPLPEHPTLAVLPFQNLSGDPEQDYFADGIVVEIIGAFSRFKSFAVVAHNSAFTYKGRAVDLRQVAAELGVRFVLEGSVRRSGNHLRISVQLADATTGMQILARNFDGAIDDIFEFQDQITASVSMLVEPQIQASELARSRRDRPESLAAYDLYLRAHAKFFLKTDDGAIEAETLLEQALALEPDDASILSLATISLMAKHVRGFAPIRPEDTVRCGLLARRGIQNAGGDAAAMARCAMALVHATKDYDFGMSVVQSALETNPNDLMVVVAAGIVHMHCGDLRQALTYLHRAMKLNARDPTAAWNLTAIAHVHMALGDFTEALVWAERSRALIPDFTCNLWMLTAANAHLGRMTEAHRYLEELKTVTPGITVSRIWAGQPQKYTDRSAAILAGLQLAGLE
jgi:TolB-like protein/tetratricopeptide (TPR) repeat protein